MVDTVRSDNTEMPSSTHDGKDDDQKTTLESTNTSGECAPSESQGEQKKNEDDDKKQEQVDETSATPSEEVTNTESKKKKKKDSSTPEQKSKDAPPAALAKIDATNEIGKENDTAKDAETTEKDKSEKNLSGGKDKRLQNDLSSGPVVSATKRTRPPYKYDPEKVTLRFLFANKDGLTVTVECKPGDTVGEVKGQLLSVWPEDLQNCTGGDQLRLICMGKGLLMPDTRTLEDCEVPVFKTHPTPVNVAVRPKENVAESSKNGKDGGTRGGGSAGASSSRTVEQTGQGCGCLIQ